jgi:hypothetical protein
MCGFPITQSPAELTFTDAFQRHFFGQIFEIKGGFGRYKAWGSLLGQQLLERNIIVVCIDYRFCSHTFP